MAGISADGGGAGFQTSGGTRDSDQYVQQGMRQGDVPDHGGTGDPGFSFSSMEFPDGVQR